MDKTSKAIPPLRMGGMLKLSWNPGKRSQFLGKNFKI
jgi:hypothetical protein